MFQKHPSGVTLIECLIAFVFLMVWKPLRGWYPDSGGTINPSETHSPPV